MQRFLFNIKIAWRNVLRAKRRSALMVLGVSFATTLMVLVIGLQEGSYNSMITFQSSLLTGMTQVQHAEYFEDKSPEYVVENAEQVVGQIETEIANQNDLQVSPRLSTGILMSYDESSRGVQLIGVDFEREGRFPGFVGNLLRQGLSVLPGQVGIGIELADTLGVEIGSELVLVGFTTDGSLSPMLATVGAIFDSGMLMFDENFAIMHLSDVQQLVDVLGGATEIAMFADHTRRYPDLLQIAVRTVERVDDQNLAVLGWEKLLPQVDESIRLKQSSTRIMFLVMILIVSVAAANGLLLSQLERTREYGLMLAVGASHQRLFWMTLLEGIFLVTAGTLIGTVLGGSFAYYLELHPIAIQGMDEITRLYGMAPTVPGEINRAVLVDTPLLMWVISMLSLVLISVRIFFLKPLESLRYTT